LSNQKRNSTLEFLVLPELNRSRSKTATNNSMRRCVADYIGRCQSLAPMRLIRISYILYIFVRPQKLTPRKELAWFLLFVFVALETA